MPEELPELVVTDAGAWRAWLDAHAAHSAGVWLVLAKKGADAPTSVTYTQALEEAVCFGWIDGLVRRRDATTYGQRFTPRRPRSAWTAGNIALAERLTREGRMAPRGAAALARAQAARR